MVAVEQNRASRKQWGNLGRESRPAPNTERESKAMPPFVRGIGRDEKEQRHEIDLISGGRGGRWVVPCEESSARTEHQGRLVYTQTVDEWTSGRIRDTKRKLDTKIITRRIDA